MATVNQYPMPPATADFVTAWAFLEEGMDHIMARPYTMSYIKYMNLYTVSYNYCTSSKMYGSSESSSEEARLFDVMCSRLYNELSHYFVQHLQHLRNNSDSLQNVPLLKYYAAEWDRYTTGAKYINYLFAYMNRRWVRPERATGRNDVYVIYTLALVQWREKFFLHIQGRELRLSDAILRLIERQRNGETIDQGLVKKVVDSFVSLGIKDTYYWGETFLATYKEHFEIPFLDITEAYYKHESDLFFAQNSGSDYLKKVEERLKEEEDRAERYLHTTTRKPLLVMFLRVHAEPMLEIFPGLLDYNKYEDLRRMYSLLSRIPESLEPLRRKFEEHVKRKGLAAVSELVGLRTDLDTIKSLELKAYVNALHDVVMKSSQTVIRCFRGEPGFIASLDRACREFVNRNAVTGASSSRSPELLAKHADVLLRKSNKVSEESDLEVSLNRVMVVFKYLVEKDVFQTFYSAKLCKRLIYGVSTSDEAEASMISKLKEASGFGYTIKFQHMFNDVRLSEGLTNSFIERMQHEHNDMDIHFSVMVLGTNFWPLKPPKDPFIVPMDIQLMYDHFEKYYQTKHADRNLTWLWNYSKNELRTNYLDQKYIFMTSTYQTAILLQYNNDDTLSLGEIAAVTNIGKDLLTQVLQPLVKSRILINSETDQYDLNLSFKSKRIRVTVNRLIQAEVKDESRDVLKTIDEGRKYVIQATIVRIMKARKTMKYRCLIEEVISQILLRFTPQVSDIKKAIDTLLDKGYIERVDAVLDAYAYIP